GPPRAAAPAVDDRRGSRRARCARRDARRDAAAGDAHLDRRSALLSRRARVRSASLGAGMRAPRVRVHASAYGNLFMTEIAHLVPAALDALGVETHFVTDELPTTERGWVNLVVAPHEFFPLFPRVSEAQCLEAAARSVLLSVEQPGTPWFGIGSAYSQVAAS